MSNNQEMPNKIDTSLLKLYQNRFIEEQFQIFDNIYIELSTLRDYKLGCVLSNVSTDKEYDYIKKQLPLYNRRVLDKFVEHFPDLNLTEYKCQQDLLDVTKHDNIFYHSPVTTAAMQLVYLLGELDKRKSVIGNKQKNVIILNTYPLTLSEEPIKLIKNFIDLSSDNTDIAIINKPVEEIKYNTIIKCDFFLMNDITPFFTKTKYGEELYRTKEFISKIIISRFFVQEDLVPVFQQENTSYEKLRLVTETSLRAYMDFQYADMLIEMDE